MTDVGVRAQFDGGEDFLLEFTKPSLQAIFDAMFQTGGFVGIARSSAAKYHDQFCKRAGGFESACRYLSTPPYRQILDLLRDNQNSARPGWIIEHPSKRRALNHYHIFDYYGAILDNTKRYLRRTRINCQLN